MRAFLLVAVVGVVGFFVYVQREVERDKLACTSIEAMKEHVKSGRIMPVCR